MGPMNTRQEVELGAILQMGIKSYRKANRLSFEQEKAVESIISCRTKKLGGHVKRCTSCGFNQQAYNSCRNRHCPKCQFVKQEQWADKLAHNLLPCKYFHVVFPLPEELRGLVFYNKEVCYSLLFKASSGALLQATSNPDFLGARSGALAVLHTWTQTLLFHPHIHMLVPAGGLSEDGMEWKSSRKKFFLPAKVLSRIFRGTMVKLLEGAVEEGTINLPHTIPVFSELKDKLYKKDWNVHLEKAFRGVNSVLKYLGRYTHRVAIANSRLVSISESNVSFRYKDNKDRGRKKVMTLQTNEFIRRFLQHVLPRNFYKIRYIGILAPVNSKTKKEQCLALIGKETYIPVLEGLNAMEVVEAIKQSDPFICPKCRKGRMAYRIRDPS